MPTFARVYTGADGQSHLEELRLSAEDVHQIPTEPGENLVFRRRTMPGWHNPPRRQFVITLLGQVEIGFGDGTTKLLGPGDISLMEDHTGRGHTTTVVDGPWLSIQIPVDINAPVRE